MSRLQTCLQPCTLSEDNVESAVSNVYYFSRHMYCRVLLHWLMRVCEMTCEIRLQEASSMQVTAGKLLDQCLGARKAWRLDGMLSRDLKHDVQGQLFLVLHVIT